MPIRSPSQNLAIIAQRYIQDEPAVTFAQEIAAQRLSTISGIRDILDKFIDGETNLDRMRNQLDLFLRRPENDVWGTSGFWMMTLNQLRNYHGSEAETELRQVLDGLDQTNLATRFERFTEFLRSEKTRLGLGSKLAAPGRSPFFLGLFARWLNRDHDIIVPWPSLRRGLKVLLDNNALPYTDNLVVDGDEIRIATSADYAAVQEVIASIQNTVPELAQTSMYWHERFLDWVNQHYQQIPTWLQTKELLVFNNDGLAPIEPARLRTQIAQLRRELLIPVDVIERMYRALVLGQHVILSGPPGTGKTELAKLLPDLLWQSESATGAAPTFNLANPSRITTEPSTKTSYTVMLATATDEWTPRHVIGGIEPSLADGELNYEIRHGCLTKTILDNWDVDAQDPQTWTNPQRHFVNVVTPHGYQEYRGVWLVIDEFNRAPIDVALGETLTAIGGSADAKLTIQFGGITKSLPIPRDFRIIGTLNTFDRHFLNQMSEALKRRFVFIDVLPPTRQEATAEQATVVRAALNRIPRVSWLNLADHMQVKEGTDATPWVVDWQNTSVLESLFAEGWRLFEVIRVYRQFGTAQAIAWCSSFLGAGVLQNLDLNDADGWRRCLSTAFADTLGDQLQILFPDEIQVILAYMRSTTSDDFSRHYNEMFAALTSNKRRNAQLLALQSIKDGQGDSYLTADQAQTLLNARQPEIPTALLNTVFHANQSRGYLGEFAQRLERFLFERTI